MLNVRQSALYIAIIGLGFAASDASAACPLGTRAVSTYTNGYKCTICVATGSEVVDATVEPFDGGEGAGDPLVNPVLTVSLTGSSPTGEPPASTFLTFTTLNTSLKAPKPPKPKMCTILIPDDDGDDDGDDAGHFHKAKVPCESVGDPNAPPNLEDENGDPVDTLTSPETPMKCDKKGVCKAIVEILPTGLFCSETGEPAADFTAKPDGDNSFILKLLVTDDSPSTPDVTEFFGCYLLTGKQYSCEPFTTAGPILDQCGSGVDGFIGATTSNTYCYTGELPAGDLLCQVGSGSD